MKAKQMIMTMGKNNNNNNYDNSIGSISGIKNQSDLADIMIHWSSIFLEHMKEEKCECKFRDVIKECLDSNA